MKQINFNDKRILKSLLDKSKTMFIEPAWEKGSPIFIHECGIDPPDCYCNRDEANYTPFCKGFTCNPTHYAGRKIIDKPFKYKEGETYEVVWDKYRTILKTTYCTWCRKDTKHTTVIRNSGIGTCTNCGNIRNYDSKNILGKVKITKIEKIEIVLNFIKINDEEIYHQGLENDFNKNLAMSLGDSSPEAMFKRLSGMGDLKESKPFWLITMEWLK